MIPDDDAPDRDDASFLRAFDRLAGARPDTRAGWADLSGRTAAPAPNRRAPRLAVLVAAASVLAFLGAVSRGAGDDRPVLQATVPSTAPSHRASPVVPSSSVATVATVPAVVSGPLVSGPLVSGPLVSASAPTTAVPSAAAADAAELRPDESPGAPSTPGSRPAGTGTTTATATATPPMTGPATSGPPSSPPSTSVIAPPQVAGTTRYAVTGGTIVVPIVDGRFGVPTVVAAPGWSYDVRKAEADRVEVRFRTEGRDATTRLTVRADGTVAIERR